MATTGEYQLPVVYKARLISDHPKKIPNNKTADGKLKNERL